MVIYKLEEDPTIFITPTYYSNRFVYRMAYVKGSNNRIIIRNIDLRKDNLTVHGTDIKEPMLQRLHGSLTLDQKQGNIYVNCDGACYFFLPGKGLCRPIHNVVFDWSPFGVVVPDSINESLRKELKEKDNVIEDINRQLLSSMASLEESKKEVKDKELELKKVNEQVSLVDFELESNKIELQSTKLELESSKKNVEELEHQLSLTMKANEDFVIQVRNLQDELSSTNSELSLTKTELDILQDHLESTKRLLESSEKEVQELKNEYCYYKEENHHMSNKIRELSDDINSIDSEVRSSNRKIEQVMLSMLWNELGLCQQLDQPRLQPTLMDVSPISDETNKSPVFIKIEGIDENV